MIYQKHCPGCFVSKSGLAVCPHCGYDESAPRSPLYLPHGAIIGGEYRIGRVLGRPGGFGITYLAWDVHLQQRVAVKEYLPKALATRNAESLDVRVLEPAGEAAYRDGLEHFLHEARVVARFNHPNIVRVRSFFRAHGTAYLVMDYYEGVNLGDYLAGLEQGRVDVRTAVELLGPVLEGLQFVHERGVVHRDIKPHNIYLTSAGRTILLDFGASLLHAGDATQQGKAILLSEGYAPLEQYQRDAPQGVAVDIYGVAATLYRMITGHAPPPPLDRMGHDALADEDLLGVPGFAAVLRKGLALQPQDRYARADEFRRALFDALELPDGVASPAEEPETRAYAAHPAATAKSPADAVTKVAEVAQAAHAGHGAVLVAAAILVGCAMIALTLWLKLPG
ncbi:serine/threonine-protein kinase [Fontimonas sp. SYSU GA230001]|uniref:serine/threonine protein kinase n=1 Tax=Fontimonas sp. SYSU GA230001 TaxID=3142450 RepID=UPI0032B553A5